MTTRSERDKCKVQQEKHQALLSQLLKEEDNKYCVDCDAKGPRWASWNLGVFLCIRCAGIHRNLGVHISKVKSVNLDTWTQEQLGMVQEMGNSRARAVYEANLPDHFRRPQTDSTLEAFIRAKYEQKKYIAKEWVPPQPKFQHSAVSEEKKEKKKARPRPSSAAASNIQLSGVSKPSSASSKSVTAAAASSAHIAKAAPPPKKKESNIDDLIGLEIQPCMATSSVTLQPTAKATGPTLLVSTEPNGTGTESAVAPAPVNNNDIFSDFISAPTEPSATAPASGSDGLEASLFGGSAGGSSEPPKSTKDSIMALFGSATQQPQLPQQPQQQNFGVPGGMYINQQAPQQQMGMQMGGVPMQNGMNGMQNGMMGGANMMGVAPNVMPGANPNVMPGANMMGGANVGMMGVPGGNNMMAAQGMQGQMMMGQMGVMPGMQQQQQVQQQQQKGQMMMGQQQMAPPAYNMATNMGAAPGVFNMQQQQPVAAANQQFQQLANQMAGMSMGAQGMTGYQNAGGIVAGGGGGAMWGAPQAGQTLSTNLWQ